MCLTSHLYPVGICARLRLWPSFPVTLYQRFENNSFGDAWLLGDSGYPLKKWLVTPLSNPVSSPEQKCNIAHQKTHSIIERAFGILKSRWRILDRTGCRLYYAPQNLKEFQKLL